jgi:hypothetical protein
MHKAKKQSVKRKHSKSIQAPTTTTKLDEIAFLGGVVEGVEQMDNDQKSRFINYIYSRYWKYITLSKLTQ